MEYPTSPLLYHSDLSFQILWTQQSYGAWTADVSKLRHERELLEDGLANCVTYLHALRKKYARNERQLNEEPSPPRKKRKKIQQSNRELMKEIKNRERNEQAFLNNLKACKTNLCLAGALSDAHTDISSPVADYASSTTQYSADESEMSWYGWARHSDVSPFTKAHDAAEYMEEIAPDELIDAADSGIIAVRGGKQPPSLRRDKTEDAPISGSNLKPDATAFTPAYHLGRPALQVDHHVDKLNDLSWLDDKDAQPAEAQATKEADVSTSMQYLTIHPQQDTHRRGTHTWCTTSAEPSPRKNTHSPTFSRGRANSL